MVSAVQIPPGEQIVNPAGYTTVYAVRQGNYGNFRIPISALPDSFPGYVKDSDVSMMAYNIVNTSFYNDPKGWYANNPSAGTATPANMTPAQIMATSNAGNGNGPVATPGNVPAFIYPSPTVTSGSGLVPSGTPSVNNTTTNPANNTTNNPNGSTGPIPGGTTGMPVDPATGFMGLNPMVLIGGLVVAYLLFKK